MADSHSAITQRLQLAYSAAREAAELTLRYFRRSDLVVDRKSDDSPVTIADRQAEEHLRRRILAAFPRDAILGEELGERAGDSGFRWILDPIDGTKSFIHGVPLYGCLVGVEHEGEPRIGVIAIPALEEYVYAASGRGAWYIYRNQEPVAARVSQVPRLAEGLFLTSEVRGFDVVGRPEVYQRLEKATRLGRTWGDCYAYLMVATGRAEVAIDPQMNIWDAAALLPILEEAGGTFTDWDGRRSITSGNGVATNRLVLNELLPLLQRS